MCLHMPPDTGINYVSERGSVFLYVIYSYLAEFSWVPLYSSAYRWNYNQMLNLKFMLCSKFSLTYQLWKNKICISKQAFKKDIDDILFQVIVGCHLSHHHSFFTFSCTDFIRMAWPWFLFSEEYFMKHILKIKLEKSFLSSRIMLKGILIIRKWIQKIIFRHYQDSDFSLQKFFHCFS